MVKMRMKRSESGEDGFIVQWSETNVLDAHVHSTTDYRRERKKENEIR